MKGCWVAGRGAVSALGLGVEPLFAAWRDGQCGIQKFRRFDPGRYQTKVAAEVDLELLPPGKSLVERIASAALAQALSDCASREVKLPDRRVLILATTKGNLEPLAARAQPGKAISPGSMNPLEMAEDLSRAYHLQAHCLVDSLACASGAGAIAWGAELLENQEAEAVIVLGVDALSDFILTGFSALKSLDPEPCKPFDQARAGLSLGEAAAALVLVPVAAKGIKPRGAILGWGIANDAFHLTAPSRDGAGLARAIQAALKSGHCSSREIHYINAHGTGTVYNDAMEAKAIASVWELPTPPVSTLKGTTGHTLGAAGVLETVATLEACCQGIAPATQGLTHPGVEEAIDLLVGQRRSLPHPATALSLFAGFGGFNAALVLSSGAAA